MSVSEPEKLGVSVLGYHFTEKAEHIPIKKRRFLFRELSPPRNTTSPSLEGDEKHETKPKLDSNVSSLPATYEAVTGLREQGSKNHKMVKKEAVEEEDFSGISILAAAAACSNTLGAELYRCDGSVIVSPMTKTREGPKTAEFNEHNVKKEPDFHASVSPFKADESTLNNFSSHVPLELAASKIKQEPSLLKSPARDVRFSWDLNTEMDACEEQIVRKHDISKDIPTYGEEKKNEYMGVKSDSPLKSIVDRNLSVVFNRLAHGNKEVKVEKCELSFHEFEIGQHGVVVKTEPLYDMHTESASDAIPVTKTLFSENPTHGSFLKSVKHCGQSSGADTNLSIDCSMPPGFGHCSNLRASKDNAGPTTQKVVNNHELSLKTANYVENCMSMVTSSKVEDEGKMKIELTSNTDIGFGFSKSEAAKGIAKLDDNSVGYDYDYEYEDGEVREWSINGWRGYEFPEGEYAYDMNRENGLDMGSLDTSSVALLGNHHKAGDIIFGSEPNEMTVGQENSERRKNVMQRASQSDGWNMNVSGWNIFPENQRMNPNNLDYARNFTARRFSYRGEQKDRFVFEDMKAEGPRFYRKESLTPIGGTSVRDGFLGRRRFQIQGYSPKKGDGLTSRPERESGALRSVGRGLYSSHDRPSCEPLRCRSPTIQEVNDFRARLGLKPTEEDSDTDEEIFVNSRRGRGRGRSMRHSTRIDGERPRGKYHGPASDEYEKFMTEYSQPFPRRSRRRCFSPIDRRGKNSYQRHRSNSRSPPRRRIRSPIGKRGLRRSSRSPVYRPDARNRRPRSPSYWDHPSEYKLGPRSRNSSPPSSGWVNRKERNVFNRSPPPGRSDWPRKKKQKDFYKSRYVGNDGDWIDNVYRRGGDFRRYNIDENRCSHEVTDSRFDDILRQQREEGSEVKRRSRDGKDTKDESEQIAGDFESGPREVKDQLTSGNLDLTVANEVVKEVD